MLYEEQKFYQGHWYRSYRDRIWSECPYRLGKRKEKWMKKIEEKVNEALAKRDDENEEES